MVLAVVFFPAAFAFANPSAPTGLAASVDGQSVKLAWQGARGDSSYRAYRSIANGAGGWTTVLSCPTQTALSCTDSAPLVAGSTYYYIIQASGRSGKVSPESNTAMITFGAPTAPSPTPSPSPVGGVSRTASLPLQGTILKVTAFTSAAIQSAINAANAGDTVDFPGGTYAVTSTLTLKPGVLYHGEPGAVLSSASGATIAKNGWNVVPSHLSIDGLTFDGGNLSLSGSSTTNLATNVTVINCTFENIKLSTDFGSMQGMILTYITNSRFDYNYFTGNGSGTQADAYAIIDYSTDNTSFSNNTLTNTDQGFHFEAGTRASGGSDGTGLNLTISNNVGTGLKEIGIEINAWISNSTISGNRFTNWQTGGSQGMAYSIVSWGSGNHVQNNYADAANCPTCNIGIEVGGTNSFIENNTIIGFETGICISSAPGTLIQGNALTGHAAGTSSGWAWGPMSKDGGWAPGYAIGSNALNGVVMVGYNVQ
jgi:hypothetical protein